MAVAVSRSRSAECVVTKEIMRERVASRLIERRDREEGREGQRGGEEEGVLRVVMQGRRKRKEVEGR